jgi:O-antigen/teichoic acid export membrane protein
MLAGLIAVPLVLRVLTDEQYGAFRTASDWFAYLGLLELGLAGASMPLIARSLTSRGSDPNAAATVGAAIRAYTRVAIPMIGAGIVLGWAAPIFIPVSPENVRDLRIGMWIAVIGLTFVPFRPLQSYLVARQQSYWLTSLFAVQAVVVAVASVAFARGGLGIRGQLLAGLLGTTIVTAALVVFVGPRIRGLVGGIRHAVTSTAWTDLWTLNTPTLIRELASRASLLSDRIIVALMLGPALVVPLFITQRLAQLGQQQLQAVSSATWAGLAELHHQGHDDLFATRVIQLTRFVAVLGVAVLGPIVAYNGHFVSQWVGIDHYAGDVVTIVAGLGALLLAITTLWDWCFGGTAKVRVLVPMTIVSSVVNVALSVALTPRLGIVGPLLGTLIAVSTTSFWYLPVLLQREFGIRTTHLLGAALTPIASGALFGAGLVWISTNFPPTGWVALGAEMSSAALAFLALWWFLGVKRTSRQELVARFKAAFNA